MASIAYASASIHSVQGGYRNYCRSILKASHQRWPNLPTPSPFCTRHRCALRRESFRRVRLSFRVQRLPAWSIDREIEKSTSPSVSLSDFRGTRGPRLSNLKAEWQAIRKVDGQLRTSVGKGCGGTRVMTDDLSGRERAKNLELKSATVIVPGENLNFVVGIEIRQVAFWWGKNYLGWFWDPDLVAF